MLTTASRVSVALALIALLSAACAPMLAPSQPQQPASPSPTRVRWLLSTTQLLEDTSPYSSLPELLGYGKAEGLDVDITAINGASTAVQLLATGQGDALAGGTSDRLLIPRSKGVSLQAFYAHVPSFIQPPAVAVDSPLTSVKDFKASASAWPRWRSRA
jgi:ABC-type nitrate/sulfonate/bicarbonate transport system substrate-binding protein